MKISKLFISVMVAATTVAALGLAPANAQAATASKCYIANISPANWGKAIAIKGSVATATFTVKGTGCTTPVTLASWKAVAPNGERLNEQKLYSHTTATFKPGVHTISVNFYPSCYWQVDLIQGANATAADGTANYDYQNGQIIDGGLRNFKQGGSTTCAVTPPTPVTPVTPTTIVTASKLPDTGASVFSLIATGLGVSMVAGLAYQLYQKRSLKNA